MQLRFGDDAERSLASREQINPIHVRGQRVTRRILGRVRQRDARHRKIDFVTARYRENAAIRKDHSQSQHVPARASVAETARSAGVSRDVTADTGRPLGRIGRVELPGLTRRCLHGFERSSRSNDGSALLDFQPLKLFERNHPAALRDAPTRQPGSSAGNGHGNRFARGLANNFDQLRLMGRNQHLISLPAEARGVD